MNTKIDPRAVVRLVIYAVGALAGLAAVILPALGIGDYTALLTSVAGAAAVITGGTAAYNIEKTPTNKANLLEVLAALKAVVNEAQAVRVEPDPGTTAPAEYIGEHRAQDGPAYTQGTTAPQVG